MFDTRSGLLADGQHRDHWRVLATGGGHPVRPRRASSPTAPSRAAIGFPMTVILPIIAILSVTSEWSQRTGLTTFTLVPHRGRVIAGQGDRLGRRRRRLDAARRSRSAPSATSSGSAIAGVDTDVGHHGRPTLLNIVLANVLGLLVGFMLGVLIRSSAGAIVAYFVYSFVLPTLSGLLAASQDWFRDLQPWVDFNFAQSALFNGTLTARAVGAPRRHRHSSGW